MYKSLYCIVIFTIGIAYSGNVYGQVKPNTAVNPGAGTSTLNAIPGAYAVNTPVSLVRVWEAMKPFAYDTSLSSVDRSAQEAKQATQYFDGLGRPLQAVGKAASPNGFDIVSAVLYDAYGRETYKYLPYTSTTSDGKFKNNPFSEQNTFMKGIYNPTNSGAGEKFYYGKADYEPSPLNRVSETYAPGNNWVGDDVGVTTTYLINGEEDSVCIWNLGYNYGDVPVFGGYYSLGQLYENVTTDEEDGIVVEYKNKLGQVVLRKVKSAATSYTGHTGWANTYYIYDDIGNLRYVIQPKATAYLSGNGWAFDNTTWSSSTIAKELCFSYEYDSKQRMITKRVPGTGEVWMIYDARDRVVMTQDNLQRSAGKWLYTDYDLLNRPVISGIWTNSSDRATHQAAAESSTTYPTPSSGYTVLTQSFYDDYSWVSGTGLTSTMITTYNSNTSFFYTASNNNFPYPQAITASYNVRGMNTGTKTNVIGSSTNLYTVSYYDDRMRIVSTQSTNNSGAKDTAIMQYSFTGQLLRTLVCHGKAGTNAQSFKVLTKNVYDNGGRITQISKKIANSPEVIIAKNEYNETGQLAQKEIGQKRDNTNINAFLPDKIDVLAYEYNIRGWLRGINKDYTRNENGASNWFGEELCYDFGFTTKQLNGNIAGIRWRSGSDNQQRAYGFTYDYLNRLTKADFTQNAGNGNWDISAGMDFSLKSMTYDINGNILTLNQKGLKINTSLTIDSLKYNYVANSNRLNYVTDKLNDPAAMLGDFTEVSNNTTQDYWYDGNGNMNKDNNKQINNIIYNFLNLPEVITVTGKGTITYTYDATGNKLKKTTVDNTVSPSKTTVTDYLGLFNYQNDTLQYISHEEGRARAKSNYNQDTIWYDYFEKDHLGNVRVILTDEVKQDVYPALTLEGTYGSGTAAVDVEKNYYDVNNAFIVANTTATGITAYTNNNGNPPYNNNPNSATGQNSTRLYKLNSNTNKTGLGITLKVMTGDRIDVYGKSYWFQNNTSGSNVNIPLADIITGLLGAPTGAVDSKGATLGLLTGGTAPTSLPASLLNRTPTAGDVKPNAGINWILFDEQFHYVSYGSSMSGNNGVVKSHNTDLQNIQVTKSGFIYIYVSNQSPVDVFFDNLQVIHTRGPLLETTEYYPFGLTMAGISSKAANITSNKEKTFQGQRFDDDLGLNWVQFKWRNHDPQIGRFIEIDPLGDKYVYNSTYAFSENKVTGHVELEGLEAVPTVGTRGVDGSYPVQGDYDDDGVVSASERESWAGAVTSWVGLGAAIVQTFANITNVVNVWRNVKNMGEGSDPTPSNQNTTPSKAQERADKLNQTPRPGKDFTKAGKEVVRDLNKEKNNGEMKCEGCRVTTTNPAQSRKGVTPPKNEAHVDHIDPKSNGGSGTPNNGQVLCRDCNLKKGATLPLPLPPTPNKFPLSPILPF